MEINTLLQTQIQEALDPVNRWYCSQYYGFEVTEPNILLAYYIKHGGAKHFRDRLGPRPMDADASITAKPQL